MSWPRPPVSMISRSQGGHPSSLDYVRKHKIMSATKSVVDVLWQDKKLFAVTVNEHVFNPIDSIVGHKLIDLVLSETIKVSGKHVIDLGCGCGVIGLCAVLRGAAKVLFTDINPHIDGIQKHPLFRKCDQWQVQDVLVDVPDSSYNLVLVLPPWMIVPEGRTISADTFEPGIFQPPDLYNRIVTESGRVLTAGGELVIWLRTSLIAFDSFLRLMNTAARHFDMTSVSLLANGIESFICLDHERSALNRWLYKRQKGGIANDALWVMLRLTKRSA